jgi:undecaprenyl-diphosphatase
VVAVLIAMATATLFILMANHVTRVYIQRIDNTFYRWMVDIHAAPLTAIALAFNFLGLAFVTLPVRVAIAGFLAYRRRWWHMTAFVAAVVASEACIGPVKNLYDRPRPPGPLVATSGSSFPSGHAVAASVTAVATVIALFPEGKSRYRWGALAVAFSMLMGLSRAYLRAHWLSDVVAGVLLGTGCALTAAVIVHAMRTRRERSRATGTTLRAAVPVE